MKTMDRIDMFKKLYRKGNGSVELRAIIGNYVKDREFVPLNIDWETTRNQVDKFCEENKDRHIYFGVATRDGKGGEKNQGRNRQVSVQALNCHTFWWWFSPLFFVG